MPVWSVSEPYISLWLHDEPLGYQPAIGPRVSFRLGYKQREATAGLNTNIFSTGRLWNFSWFSYATQTGGTNWVHFSGGREVTYQGTNDYLTGTSISGNTNSGFTIYYPNGSQDVYGFIVTNNHGAFQEAFLSEQRNPQGQKTDLYYSSYNPTNPVVRLSSVIDGAGQTNTVTYVTSSPYSTNLISQVTDPYGRSVSLKYDNSGHLTNITDVAGISSSFTYDGGDMVTNLTTPYGSTGFNLSPAAYYTTRSILITQPDGGNHFYLYQDYTPGIPNSYPAAQIPNTGPFSNTLDTNNLAYRNTFYWGPRQYPNLSTTNIAQLTANDYLKGRMRHWLIGSTLVGDTLSMERAPSPDTNGVIEGHRMWYDYSGKTNLEYEGTQFRPLFKAHVLPDGTTRHTQGLRNSLGWTTNLITTYSATSGGAVSYRTNTYVYDPNGIDVLMVTNATGVLVSSNMYNTNHQITTNYNALREMAVYTYDGSNRLASATSHSGVVTTYSYGSDGFLSQQIVTGFATNSYTYANGLVATRTDSRGVTTTNNWDNLQRLTKMTFPDGTFITNTYQNLDLVQRVDRLGHTTSFGYDSMRRMSAATNALGKYTLFNHCTCGALSSIQDAAGNVTTFNRDNLSRATNIVYANDYSVTRQFNAIGQVTNSVDSAGVSVTNWFDNQGLPLAISNSLGQVQMMAYDNLNRVTNEVDANGVSVTITYDNLNRVLTRVYPNGSGETNGYTANVPGPTAYTNQLGNVWTYAYDAAYRKTNEVALGIYTNSYSYDGLGDLLTLTDGNGNTTSWNYDQFGRVTNKVDATNNVIFTFAYDVNNRLTNRWTPMSSNTVYAYDSVGNLTNISYTHSPAVGFAYDALNRLTNMVDAVGATAYTYDPSGLLLTEDGPWADDTVSYTYQNNLRKAMSIGAPNASAWNQTYGYDSAERLTSVTSPAGAFTYTLGAMGTASPLIQKLLLPNGAYVTNHYDNMARLLGTYLRNSSGVNLDTDDYVYNQGGQRTQQVFTAGNYMNYTYDNIGELQTATGLEPGGVTNRMQEQLGYTYDPAGNLIKQTNNTVIRTLMVNPLNELFLINKSGLLTVAGTTTSPATNVTVNTSNAVLYVDNTFASTNQPYFTGATNFFTAIAKDSYGRMDTNTVQTYYPSHENFSYDLNGNLTNELDGRVFAYDDENQLTAVWVTNTWLSTFTYDGKFRRRIRREYNWQSSTSTWQLTNEVHYIYDGNVVVQERDGNNLPQVTYTRGLDISESLQKSGGIGGLLARTANPLTLNPTTSASATAYYHSDESGNIRVLIYTNQTIAAKYEYDPFGNVLSQSGPLAGANLYRYSSQEYHVASGLICYLRRFYDPNLQRWINRDPSGESAGKNLYGFVGNNPISVVDARGLQGTIVTDGTSPFADPNAAYLNLILPAPGQSFLWAPSPSSSGNCGDDPLVDWLNGAAEIMQDLAIYLTAETGVPAEELGVDVGLSDLAAKLAADDAAVQARIQAYLSASGGRLGGADTRALNDAIASYYENLGNEVINGAGRESEEWIQGLNGGTLGGTWVDIKVQAADGSIIRIQTVSTLADGVTPTANEIAAALRIQSAFPNDTLILIAKPQ